MTYTIKNAMQTGSFTTKAGTTLNKFMLSLEDAEGKQVAAELSQKPETPAPTIGSTIEGEVEQTQFGPRFKKAQQGFGGPGGGRFNDPETRKEIIRQNALTNAVNRAVEIARIYQAESDREAALAALKPTSICKAAYHFARFTMGEWNPMDAEDKAEEAEKVFGQPTQDVNNDEIPF